MRACHITSCVVRISPISFKLACSLYITNHDGTHLPQVSHRSDHSKPCRSLCLELLPMQRRAMRIDLFRITRDLLEHSRPIHLNVHTEFDPGMVGKGLLLCYMTSLRK